MTVLLVGAAGFLGSHIERALFEEGFEVVAVDVSPPRRDSMVPPKNWVTGDICELDWLQFGTSISDVICTAASLRLGFTSSDWHSSVDVNVNGMARLVDWSVSAGVRSFVFTSSAGMYKRTLTSETISESAPLDPKAPYWTSKLLLEQLLFSTDVAAQLAPWVLRLSSPYGPGQRTDSVLPRFINSARSGRQLTVFDGGTRSQDFVWVRDAAEAHVRCLLAPRPADPGPINLGSGEETSMMQLAHLVSDLYGGSESFITDVATDTPDDSRFRLDISRARQHLQFQPRSLRDGLTLMRDSL